MKIIMRTILFNDNSDTNWSELSAGHSIERLWIFKFSAIFIVWFKLYIILHYSRRMWWWFIITLWVWRVVSVFTDNIVWVSKPWHSFIVYLIIYCLLCLYVFDRQRMNWSEKFVSYKYVGFLWSDGSPIVFISDLARIF